MQTTLLGIAVAIILALVTALVGPLLIDWGRWRTQLEAEASRLIGLPVRVNGAIEARLLPTPSLAIRDIVVGPPWREPQLSARRVAIEFGLGALLRGEVRAAELHIDAPEINLGLDRSGKLDAVPAAIGFDPDQLAIERLVVENGRAVFSDAASGGRLVLDKLWFNGEVRSLAGPFKGDGAFVSSGQIYGYRLSGNRRGEDGSVKLRLAVDPSDRPLAMETEGTLWVERAAPHYEGSVTLSRPAGAVLRGGKTVANEPWRATSKVRAGAAATLFEQVEFQYGPEDRALRLTGTADLHFGARPKFEAVLSARQIDLDRTLSADGMPRPPAAVFKALAETLSESIRPPLPVKIGLGVDNLIIGGAPVTALRGDVVTDAGNWSIESLEFRAPGASQVRVSGRLQLAGQPEFSGPASLDSADPKALIAWLEGKAEASRGQIGPLRARGDLALGADRIVVDRLRADVDRKAIEGRLAYAYATPGRPASLDAALSAAEFDIDGAIAFVGNALAGTSFDRPGDIALEVELGKAAYAGIEAKTVKAKLKFDAAGLNVERLSIADFGGAVLDGSGRIDTASALPRGALALTLQARRLDGVQALLAKLSPNVAQALAQLPPAGAATKITARLDVEPVPAAGKSTAKLKVEGAIAGLRVDLTAEGSGDLDRPDKADIRLDGRLEADDGAALAAMVGLDRLARLDKRPARLALVAKGPVLGDLAVDASFAGAGLDATAAGKVRRGEGGWNGTLAVTLNAADLRLLGVAGAVPVTVSTKLTLAGAGAVLDDLSGKIAGSAIKGRLKLDAGSPTRVEGRIEADTLEAVGLIGAALGVSAQAQQRAGWSLEPFAPSPVADLVGEIDLSLARAIFAPGLVARQVHALARIEPGAVVLDEIEGSLGEGRFQARAAFRRSDAGVTTDSRFSLSNADVAALMPRSLLGQVSGRVSLAVEVSGTGLSPAALVGGLEGRGSLTVENLQVLGLDPQAIEAALRAADRGMPADAIRIGDVVRVALDAGRLNVPDVSAGVAISGGRATLADVIAAAEGADVAASGRWGIMDDLLDVKFTLTGPPKPNAPGGQRPQIAVSLKGPIDGAKRSVDVTALVNWLTMRAVELEARRVEAAEQEAKRLAEEIARRAAEQEAKRLQALEEAKRQQAAEDARRQQQAAEEAKRQLAEDEAKRQAEDETKRRRAAEEARRAAVESERRTASDTGLAPALPPPVVIAPPPGGVGAAGERRPRSPAPPRAGNVAPPSPAAPTAPADPR